MKELICATALFQILLWPVTAGPVPGRWEKVDSLPSRSEITLVLVAGEELHVVFLGTTPDNLSIRDDSDPKRERRIPKRAVQIVLWKHRDSLTRGMLLGAGIGYAATFSTLLAAGQGASDPAAPIAAIWGFVGAGVGALIGGAADAAVKETEVLYTRRTQP